MVTGVALRETSQIPLHAGEHAISTRMMTTAAADRPSFRRVSVRSAYGPVGRVEAVEVDIGGATVDVLADVAYHPDCPGWSSPTATA